MTVGQDLAETEMQAPPDPSTVGDGDTPTQDIRQFFSLVALLVVDPIEKAQGLAVIGSSAKHLSQHVLHPHQSGQLDVEHRGQTEKDVAAGRRSLARDAAPPCCRT